MTTTTQSIATQSTIALLKPHQRRVLESIASGETSPFAEHRVLKVLLKKKLIRKLPPFTVDGRSVIFDRYECAEGVKELLTPSP